MSRRTPHHHLAWDSQPLVRPTERPRRFTLPAVVAIAVAAFVLGLLI